MAKKLLSLLILLSVLSSSCAFADLADEENAYFISESGRFSFELVENGYCYWYQDEIRFAGKYYETPDRIILNLMGQKTYSDTEFVCRWEGDMLYVKGGIVDEAFIPSLKTDSVLAQDREVEARTARKRKSSGKIRFNETVLADQEGITATALSYGADGNMESIRLTIENNSDRDIGVKISSFKINGICIYTNTIFDVAAHQTTKDKICFRTALLEAAGVKQVESIAISLKAQEDDRILFSTDEVEIPVIDSRDRVSTMVPIHRAFRFEDRYRMKFVGYEWTNDNFDLYYYLENNSDSAVEIWGNNGQLNGFSCSSINTDIEAHSAVLYKESIFILPSNRISGLKSYKLDFEIRDTETYRTIATIDDITMEFEPDGQLCSFSFSSPDGRESADLQQQPEIQETAPDSTPVPVFSPSPTPDTSDHHVGAYIEGDPSGNRYMLIPKEDEIVTTVNSAGVEISYISGELLVQASTNAGYDEMEELFQRYGFTIVGYIGISDTFQIRSDGKQTEKELNDAMNQLLREKNVDAVSLDIISEIFLEEYPLPIDPWSDGSYSDPVSDTRIDGGNWGVEAIHAPWFWKNYSLPGINVGVFDNMFVDYEDLSYSKIFHNEYSTAYIYYSHGTFVSSIIGARHNETGICGVLKEPNLYAAGWKYLNNSSENNSLLGNLMKTTELLDAGVRVINFSVGYQKEYCTEEYVAPLADWMGNQLRRILAKGYDFILVNSAGNEHIDSQYNYWASAINDQMVKDRILVVGGAQIAENKYQLCDFSNYGSRLDVVAPGYHIMGGYLNSSGRAMYDAKNGTSCAAPMVTAACAALWNYYPSLSGADVKKLLVSTADIDVEGTQAKMINLEASFGGLEENALPNHSTMSLDEVLDAYKGSRKGISDIVIALNSSVRSDVDFDGRPDDISFSHYGSTFLLCIDFGSGYHWQQTINGDPDADRYPDSMRFLSFTCGDYICYVPIVENTASKYGGLFYAIFGQDYYHNGEIEKVHIEHAITLNCYAGVYNNRVVIVVRNQTGTLNQVFSIAEPLYTQISQRWSDYQVLSLPIPEADGFCYYIGTEERSDGQGYNLILSQLHSSDLGVLECPGTTYGSFKIQSADYAVCERVWFENDTNYLVLLPGVSSSMVGNLVLPTPEPEPEYYPPADFYVLPDGDTSWEWIPGAY